MGVFLKMAHLTDVPYISFDNIDYLIGCLNEVLIKKYQAKLQHFKILVVGGSALALKYNYRSTVDIDADIKFQSEITSSIHEVARINNIPTDWINQDFVKSESYSRRLWEHAIPYKTIGFIDVFVVSDLDQLCMKLVSGRAKDKKDALFLSTNVIQQGITFSDLTNEFKFLYGDYIKPNSRFLSAVKRMFKRANLL